MIWVRRCEASEENAVDQEKHANLKRNLTNQEKRANLKRNAIVEKQRNVGVVLKNVAELKKDNYNKNIIIIKTIYIYIYGNKK